MENASHDSNSKKFLGKNIFTNAFPLSLANYMHRERDLSIPVVTAYVEEEIIKTRSRGWSTSHATRSRPLRSDVARFVPTSNPASVARPERVLPVHTSARSAGPCGQVCGGRTSLRHPWLPPKNSRTMCLCPASKDAARGKSRAASLLAGVVYPSRKTSMP